MQETQAKDMIRKFERTNIFVIDKELWAWAAYRAKTLDYGSTSEYLFQLILLDKEKNIVKKAKPR